MKKLLSIILVLALAIGSIACTTQPEESATTEPAAAGEAAPAEEPAALAPEDYAGEIKILTWSESEIATYAEVFNKVYPNVKVTAVLADNGDVNTKMETILASGGDMPDVVYAEMATRGKVIAMNCWEDLSKAPYNFDGSALQASLKKCITNDAGEVVVVEQNYNPAGMAYRRSLAEQYLGTSDPAQVAAKIGTWADFYTVGESIYTQSNGTVTALPGLDEINWMIASQYTDPVFEGDTGNLTPYFTYMFDIMTNLRDHHCVGKINRWTADWNASYNNGSVVFWQFAPWSFTAAIQPNATGLDGDFSVIMAPGGAYYLGGTGFAIPKDSKNKDLAWLFVNYCLVNKDGVSEGISKLDYLTPVAGFYDGRDQISSDASIAFFNGQDVNKFLLDEISPIMNLRAVSAYDTVVSEVVSYMMTMIQDDPTIDTATAVQMALEEARNMLPDTMTIN